ncbi:MAG: Choline-sulfatase [Chlamydiae bacterium]|nr:Choline-sulfatase [Chlamydiota bacterium]
MRALSIFLTLLCLPQMIFSVESELKQPNIIVLMTDQERLPMHWPAGWVKNHLPSQERLMKHGLSFQRAYTSASMCSPSRAALLTSQYSIVNHVSETLSETTPSPTLPSKDVLTNLSSLIQEKTNYDVVWKGKWHLSYAVDGLEKWSEKDIANMKKTYSPEEWNPPDAGNADHSDYIRDKKFALSTLGGGYANNDMRYVRGMVSSDKKEVKGWGEPILDYLERVGTKDKKTRKPFCLFISLVNPHDVWVSPIGYGDGGYRLKDFENMGIDLPSNFNDSLKTKPSIQLKARDAINRIAPFKNQKEMQDYVNFYAYLHTVVDKEIMAILDSLEKHDLLKDTIIIRTADHGELGLSHGMREKAYTAYEEEIHVPFIISNPTLYPTPKSTEAFYSHLDLIPTISDLIGFSYDHSDFQGISQKPVILGQKESVRDSIVFAYDDVYLLPKDTPSSHIRCLRYQNWTYAIYFSPNGTGFEYELYDLDKDPGQLNNLLYGKEASQHTQLANQLHEKLTKLLRKEDGLPKGMYWPSLLKIP